MRYRRVLTAVGAAAIVWGFSPAASGQPADGSSQSKAQEACEDSQGAAYGPGFVVTLGGKRMKCVVGPHWVPMDPTPASAPEDVLDVGDINLNAEGEAAILKAFRGSGLPPLECDALLNSEMSVPDLTRVPPGQKRVLMFWTPTCGPCKPLLADLAALAAAKPTGLSVVGVVRSAEPDLEPPGEWRLERVKRIVAEYQVGFPTCVHSSKRVTEAWRAGGVPITFLLSDKGVERVAGGGRNGRALVAELSGSAKVGER